MSKLISKILYRGAVYRLADDGQGYVDSSLADSIKEEAERAVAAIGGSRSGQQIGGYTKLRDGGEPWSIEVTAPVVRLQPASAIAEEFSYSTIDWCGWVEVRVVNGAPQITATGTLALDGMCFDDGARVLRDQHVINGAWDGTNWSWVRDIKS